MRHNNIVVFRLMTFRQWVTATHFDRPHMLFCSLHPFLISLINKRRQRYSHFSTTLNIKCCVVIFRYFSYSLCVFDNVRSNVTSQSYFDEMFTWRTCQEREVFFFYSNHLLLFSARARQLKRVQWSVSFYELHDQHLVLFFSAKVHRRDNPNEITWNSSEEIARQEKSFARLHAHTRVARAAADKSRWLLKWILREFNSCIFDVICASPKYIFPSYHISVVNFSLPLALCHSGFHE